MIQKYENRTYLFENVKTRNVGSYDVITTVNKVTLPQDRRVSLETQSACYMFYN